VPDTIRFPDQTHEKSEIITLFMNTATIFKGGQNLMAQISKLQQASRDPVSSAFIDLVIEFTADQPVTIGDGASNIVGLYGEISPPGGIGNSQRFLLGNLGVSLGPGLSPQIPIVDVGIPNMIGFAQIIQASTVYDFIGVGGILADIPLGGPVVTCTVRPLIIRSYAG
jgi:hypothetical protein